MCTQENSVHTYKDHNFFVVLSCQRSRLKRQRNTADGRKETVFVKEYKGSKHLRFEWKWEAQGKKREASQPLKGLRRSSEGKSAKVTLIVLYGFLDAEKHGGEPLVQPRDGVKFLHLRPKSNILESTTKTKSEKGEVVLILLFITRYKTDNTKQFVRIWWH